MRLLAEGRTLDEIAAIRGRQRSTIVSLVSDLVERGEIEFQAAWVDQAKQNKIEDACGTLGLSKLTPIKDALPAGFTYEEIRLVVARLRRQEEDNAAL
jgi:ATP-dependent DNA helicase RecQ